MKNVEREEVGMSSEIKETDGLRLGRGLRGCKILIVGMCGEGWVRSKILRIS